MKKRLVLVVSLLVLATGYFSYRHYQRQDAIRAALAYARLPPLPATAREVQVETSGGLFARTFWLRFQADEPGLRTWLGRCRSLQATATDSPPAVKRAADAPPWFRPPLRPNGQVFDIPFNQAALYGTVWIDWQTRQVYIQTSHS